MRLTAERILFRDYVLTGQRHVWLPYKPEAPAIEQFATRSLAGASGLYSLRFS
jgi:hypothetical protein